jgi:hypothetical protein
MRTESPRQILLTWELGCGLGLLLNLLSLAARAFAARHASCDPEVQVQKMVARAEELLR